MLYESVFIVRTSFLESCAHIIGYCGTYSEAWTVANTIDPDHADALIVEACHLELIPREPCDESE